MPNSNFINRFKGKLLQSDNFFKLYDDLRRFDIISILRDQRRNSEIINNLKGKSSPFIAEFNGAKFWIDPKANQDLHMYDGILKNGYESITTKLILESLVEGDTFIDIGSNNGYFTVLASKKVGKEGTVYAFEPSSTTYKRLMRNLELNNCDNVKAYNLAVSNGRGKTSFYEFPDRDGENSLVPLSGTKEITVNVVTLDEMCENVRPKIVKIDVEGYEREVLDGARHVIFDNNASIILEYNRHVLLRKKENFDDLLTSIRAAGYTIRMIDDIHKSIGETDIRDHHNLHPIGCNIFCTKT